ncbi:PQQ-binding-like beta-propeller repeat protein [candidate division KSB1 bacterium]|nr:PQQ-binding-like beta-propeller repeat protein [candidate division KSB1 bacterium]
MKSFCRLLAFFLFCTAPSFPQTPPLRFTWLSDTHVGSTTGAADLSRTVRDINAISDIDFVMLSGDITEMGSNAELELAKAILDSLNKPYHIIPGNHDTKWSESGATKFPALWGSDKFVFESSGYRFIGLHQGPIMRMGDGHFSPEDLRWLDSVLVHLPDKNQPLFFVTHYPIDSSIDNWYELLDRAKRYNMQAMLCGHGHRNKVLNFEGIPGVMGRSNLRASDSSGGYTIAEIKADSIFFSERITGSETKPVWHKLALGVRSYTADTTRYARPEFSINQKYPQVKVKWIYATDYTIAAAPAVWKDVIVAGNSNGAVYGLSLQDGKEQWRFQTGKGVYSTPAIANDKVVFGSADGNIYCLNVTDAKLIWKFPTAAPVVATPRIENGMVYLGSSDQKFRAIHLDTGQLKWEFDGVSGFVETKPLIYDGKVIFGAWGTFLYALNRKDGALAWQWTNGNPGVLYSPAACWPVAAHGKIFIVAPDRFMTAIDAATGKTVWRSNRHQVREAIGLSADAQTVYARCMTDTLLAFSASATTPQLQWLTSCGYGYDIDPSMPLEKDGVIFFGTKNGFVFAVDAKSGAVKWQHRVGVTVVNTVAPIAENRVVATDMDGRVMLLVAE